MLEQSNTSEIVGMTANILCSKSSEARSQGNGLTALILTVLGSTMVSAWKCNVNDLIFSSTVSMQWCDRCLKIHATTL